MFKPDFILNSVADIDVKFLMRIGARGLILDIDNTLAIPDEKTVPEEISLWIAEMKKCGVPMVLLSNNSAERISSFAKLVDIPFVAKGGKPLKKGYVKAAELLNSPIYRCAAVGDQLFTDIWGGNNAKAVTVLTMPFAKDQTFFISIKRILEKPLLKKYRRKNNDS